MMNLILLNELLEVFEMVQILQHNHKRIHLLRLFDHFIRLHNQLSLQLILVVAIFFWHSIR